jgi:VCBS repeat-containing protein
MAIEDPRTSSFDIESEVGFPHGDGDSGAGEMVMAQAGTGGNPGNAALFGQGGQGGVGPIGQGGQGGQGGAALFGQGGQGGQGGAAGVQVVAPDAGNVVHLPAGVSIDDIKVEGTDLVLVQADGSEIRIPQAALDVPTFVIGDVEVARDVLVAVLETNGINVAAGPDGTLAVVGAGPQGSGGNFQDGSVDFGNESPNVLNLLGDTGLGDGSGDNNELNAGQSNVAPSILGGASTGAPGTMVETADVVDGIDLDPAPVTGSIAFFDPDFGETRTAVVSDRTVAAANLDNGLTLSQAQIDALLAGFSLDSSATGGITVEPSAAGNGRVDWTYALGNAAIDFLAAGETVVLTFQVTIVDGIQSASSTVQITIQGTNDAPVFEVDADA